MKRKRSYLSGAFLLFFCSALFCLGITAKAANSKVWDGASVSKPSQVNGVYQISNAEELAWFAGMVNGSIDGVTSDKKANAVLTADIDLGNKAWTPIAEYETKQYRYNGTFDGKGHTISGFYNYTDSTYQGLFGSIGSNGWVKNLTIKGELHCGMYSGGIVGFLTGKVSNCHNYMSIYATGSYIGGIAGEARENAVLTKCSNHADLETKFGRIGGIVGDANGLTETSGNVQIVDCANFGSITLSSDEIDVNAHRYVGGIVGAAYGCSLLKNCYNEGTITGYIYTGGLAGAFYFWRNDSDSDERNCTVENIYNTGDVYGHSVTGGIAGALHADAIQNFYNTGSISSESDADYIGGISGDYLSAGLISNGYVAPRKGIYDYALSDGVGGSTIKNVYALEGSFTKLYQEHEWSGYNVDSKTVGSKSESYMKSADFVKLLNGSSTNFFKQDTKGMNNGYPIANLPAIQSPYAPTVTTKAVDQSTIKVSWTQTEAALGYQIYRKTGSGSYKLLKEVDENTTSYTDKSAVKGTTYYYMVRGYNRVNGVTYQGVNSAAVKGVTNCPSKGNITSVSSSNYNKLKISWKKISDASGYDLYAAASKNGTYRKLKTLSASAASYTHSVECGKTMYYKIRAYRMVAGVRYDGTLSDVQSGKAIPKTAKLSKVKSEGFSTLQITWKKVDGASGYVLYRSTSKKGTYKKVKALSGGSVTSYNNTGLSVGKTYYYKVKAYRTVNGRKVYGAFSSIRSGKPVVPKTTLSSVTLVNTKLTAKYGKCKLAWKKCSGASGYEIYMAASKKGTYKKVKTVTKAKTVTYTQTKLTKNKTYYFKIRAYKKSGSKKAYGSYSAVKKIKIQ